MKTLLCKLFVLTGLLILSFYAAANESTGGNDENKCTASYFDTGGYLNPESHDNGWQWKSKKDITQTLTEYKIGCYLEMHDHDTKYSTAVTGYQYCSPNIHYWGVFLLTADGHDLIFRTLEDAEKFEKAILSNVDAEKSSDKKPEVLASSHGNSLLVAVGYLTGSPIPEERVKLYYLKNPHGQDAQSNPCDNSKDSKNFPDVNDPEAYKHSYPFTPFFKPVVPKVMPGVSASPF